MDSTRKPVSGLNGEGAGAGLLLVLKATAESLRGGKKKIFKSSSAASSWVQGLQELSAYLAVIKNSKTEQNVLTLLSNKSVNGADHDVVGIWVSCSHMFISVLMEECPQPFDEILAFGFLHWVVGFVSGIATERERSSDDTA